MDPKDLIDIDYIVEKINAKVNIPFLNEEQERIVIRAILMLIIGAFPKKN